FNGSDSFTYKANDGQLDSTTATVTLTIDAVNDAPVAHDNSSSTNEDTRPTVTAPGVLGNDTDIDSATITAVLVAGTSHGRLTLNSTGSFSYTPDANYNGADSFTYKANDGSLDSNTATVTLTITAVNDAPVAQDTSATTNEDTALSITLLATDVDGDSLSYSIVPASGPIHGTLGIVTGNTVSYTPAANYNGS